MIFEVYRVLLEGHRMLGKVLGIVTAGVFVGAAAVEISGYLSRRRTGKGRGQEPKPAAVDPSVERTKGHDENAPRTEG